MSHSASTYRSKRASRVGSSYTSPMSRDSSSEGVSPAMRKKADGDGSKKGRSSRRTSQVQKVEPGTVSALRPTQALTVHESFLVVEAAQMMAAKRADCVLVIDDNDEHLSGIFTAKDLAFRVVGDGLDARTTVVRQIMTRDPKCVKSDTSATNALETMVKCGFRHLPVCNDDGDVVGLLDITKCLYEALDKMERAYGSSKKLYDALEGVEREWSNQPTQIVQYLQILREKMACPDLNTVLDGSSPAEVTVQTSVRDAARLMSERRTTAVLVMDHNRLSGIFTSKDIVLRVIAAGLDPGICNVFRVMTPHPDTAPSNTSILDALKKMHEGHYLNLPVVDDGQVVGMVDVLKLTYATMDQASSIQGPEGSQENSGPMWSRFFAYDEDDNSVISDAISPSQSASNIPPLSPSSPVRGSGHISPIPEIHPSESASAIDENGSASSFPRAHEDYMFTFKFKAPDGKTHRFTVDYTSLDNVRRGVAAKLADYKSPLTLSYLDDDNDQVLMSTDEDVIDAVRCAQRQSLSRVILSVQEPKQKKSSKMQSRSGEELYSDDEEDDLDSDEYEEERMRNKRRRHRRRRASYDENLPIPKDLLLPGAITILSVAIVGVYMASRLSR